MAQLVEHIPGFRAQSPPPHKPEVVAQVCNPSYQEVVGGGSEVQDYSRLHCEFEASYNDTLL